MYYELQQISNFRRVEAVSKVGKTAEKPPLEVIQLNKCRRARGEVDNSLSCAPLCSSTRVFSVLVVACHTHTQEQTWFLHTSSHTSCSAYHPHVGKIIAAARDLSFQSVTKERPPICLRPLSMLLAGQKKYHRFSPSEQSKGNPHTTSVEFPAIIACFAFSCNVFGVPVDSDDHKWFIVSLPRSRPMPGVLTYTQLYSNQCHKGSWKIKIPKIPHVFLWHFNNRKSK